MKTQMTLGLALLATLTLAACGPDYDDDRQSRLRKQEEFDRVYRSKSYAADDVLVMNGCPNGSDRSRLGLAISRKVGNAVLRNRWKRLIREVFRTHRAKLPRGFDFVVRPRRGAEPDFASIAVSLPNLARRIARLRDGGRP